jgi:hypothetical protein
MIVFTMEYPNGTGIVVATYRPEEVVAVTVAAHKPGSIVRPDAPPTARIELPEKDAREMALCILEGCGVEDVAGLRAFVHHATTST